MFVSSHSMVVYLRGSDTVFLCLIYLYDVILFFMVVCFC